MLPESWRQLGSGIWRRLRTKVTHSVGFVVLGSTIACMTMVPNWLPHMNDFSTRELYPRWAYDIRSVLVGATLLVFAMRACTDRGAELAQRPARFVLLLVLGASAATVIMWFLIARVKGVPLGRIPRDEVFNTWWETLLWGGLVGWLYVLSLRRNNDQEQLDVLLLRRTQLARELARARLGTARAQIDPTTVARILREVYRRYHAQQESAPDLLDHLISYLRLAMNRNGARVPSLPGEVALVRAYLALQEAEHGMTIGCEIDLGTTDFAATDLGTTAGHGAVPLFLVVRALLEVAVPLRALAMQLRCVLAGGSMRIELSLDGASPAPTICAQLGLALQQLLPGVRDTLECITEPGVNRYVVNLIAD